MGFTVFQFWLVFKEKELLFGLFASRGFPEVGPLFNLTPDLMVSRLGFSIQCLNAQKLKGGARIILAVVGLKREISLRSQDCVVLGHKVSGPSGQMIWIQGERKCLDTWIITEAIQNSAYRGQLDALGRAVDAGKIRYIGLRNDMPFVVMKFPQVAVIGAGYPKIISVLCSLLDLPNL
ncbi:hypothetical protein F0562_021326 [Nyssa sinensis]|uniref:Uncharacterized protein n=1 Tax=Nyssa sinensis TaxID=561372 RepID=A0A5J5BK36_9ASTE|nr:hypothetical protein F0562_021326 [Nyssa sinensis]